MDISSSKLGTVRDAARRMHLKDIVKCRTGDLRVMATQIEAASPAPSTSATTAAAAAAEDAPNEAADGGRTSSSPVYRDLFDKVLLDAPCSGTGVLAKRSDLRWRRTLEEVQGLAQLQGELLPAAAKFVKPGGLLVYSTCCLEQEENEDRVAAFLASEAGQVFELEPPASGSMPEGVITKEGYLLVLPHEHNMDGAFAARLRRKVQ